MSDAKRLEGLKASGITGIAVNKLPTETEIVNLLSGIATGLLNIADATKT